MTITSTDDTPGVARPRRLVRGVVAGFLLPLAILGALSLSAAATLAKAARHGVPVEVQPAAVAMLEVVSLTGTLLWLFAPDPRLRRHAALATMASSGVQLAAGISAYGWFGTVAPIALVVTTHLASEAWRADWRRVDSPAERTEPEGPTLRERAVARVKAWWTAELPDTSEDDSDTSTDDQPDSDDELDEQDDEREPLPVVKGVDPVVVAQAAELLEREPLAGRPRVRAYCGVTDHAAGKLLAALRLIRAVGVGESA